MFTKYTVHNMYYYASIFEAGLWSTYAATVYDKLFILQVTNDGKVFKTDVNTNGNYPFTTFQLKCI